MQRLTCWLAIVLVGALLQPASQQNFDAVLRDGFQYRNLGPFRVGGWVSEIAVPETPARAHLYTFYVAARHGGVWKTSNNGTTFEPVFHNQNVVSVGSLAVAPSNADHVWVGTGDASCARSAYWGDGVYKSIDGGTTWQNVGLKESHHVARIIVHPANPDVVYVAAMGHLFSPNEERGVFKTSDGGKSWKKVLYLNDRTGAIDLVINRNDPNTLYAAMYECLRDPWRIQDGGQGSGIYKTTDGGANWKKLENGLPAGTLGRIGIGLYQKNPNTLYAVVDNRNVRQGQTSLIGGEVYRSDDAGETWRKASADKDDVSRKSGYAFNQIKVDPANPERAFITGSNLIETTDGGKTWAGLSNFGEGRPTEGRQPPYRPFRRAFGDFRTLWIDPQNPERMMAGSDGGIFVSYDGGKTCDHLNNLPLGEVYALTVDMEEPYNIYAGLQDHESWKGPSNGWSGSIGLEDWTTVGIGDGMYNQVDPTDSRWLFNTQEFGRHARLDQKTRERKVIAPTRPQGQPPKQDMLRFNWVAPLRISPHDPKTIYAGAQVLFRSRDRGDTWEEISPDLTTNDASKISPPGAAIQFCTITTIAESPAQAGVIWVGADDGRVQMTRDAGKTWSDVTKAIAKSGGPEDAWVTRVFASHTRPGTAYVAKSKLRQDDFRPFLFKTTDFGATWMAITNGLPARTVNVIFEDQKNPDLLFAGNDAGVYVSLDGGKRWAALKGNMPVVAVQDLVVHPREGDLVVGTYGRGIWIMDITPLRELSQALAQDAHLFAIEPKARRREGALGNYRLYGDRLAVTPNEPNGMTFTYYLKESPKEKVTLTVTDATGKTVRMLEPVAKAGLNRVVWEMSEGGRGPAQGGEFRPGPGAGLRIVPAGEYTVTLQVGEKKLTQNARVLAAKTGE